MHLTKRGLYLVDINDIALAAERKQSGKDHAAKPVGSTFVTLPDDRQTGSNTDGDEPGDMLGKHEMQAGPMKDAPPETSAIQSTDHIRNSEPLKMQPDRSKSEAQGPIDHQTQTSPVNHVAEQSPEEPAAGSRTSDPRHERPDHKQSGKSDHQFRSETQGQEVSRSLGRSGMGSVHGKSIRQVRESESSEVSEVRRSHGDSPRGTTVAHHHERKSSDHQPWYRNCLTDNPWPAKGQSQSQGDAPCHGIQCPYAGSQPFARLGPGRRRMGESFHDISDGVYAGKFDWPEPRIPSNEPKAPAHGKCPAAGHRSLGAPGSGGRGGDSIINDNPDDAEVFTQVHVDQHRVWHQIRLFQKELDEIRNQVQPMGRQHDLAEIFCGPSSMLTHQVQQLGGTAFRFGLEQGDLSTMEGRKSLFRKMALHRLRHVWMSPVCGPWSSWSRLNESRSMESQQKYQQDRQDLLYQIALAIVLYRFQISQGRHFHLEQLQRSLLVHQPSLAEIYQHTQVAEFDLCRMGNMTCPKAGLPMKKGMQVITTFEPMYRMLHGKQCRHDHEHQPIEGTIMLKHGPMLRSQYTENYPRVFARSLAKIMHKAGYTWPFNWHAGLMVESTRPTECESVLVAKKIPKVPGRPMNKPEYPKSELVEPVPMSEGEVKRRRLHGKQSSEPTMEELQQLMQDIHKRVPRVVVASYCRTIPYSDHSNSCSPIRGSYQLLHVEGRIGPWHHQQISFHHKPHTEDH